MGGDKHKGKLKLYPHQKKALEIIKKHKRGIISAFCGTGKSKIIQQVVERRINKGAYKILIIFPSLMLIQQFHEDHLADFKNLYVICSESSQKMHQIKFPAVVLTTYQSLGKFNRLITKFDLVICDEAHHICTESRIKILSKYKGKIYFFTATPQSTEILDMFEKKSLTGGIIFEYDFTQALKDKIIADYYLNFCIFRCDETQNFELQQFQAIINLAHSEKRKRLVVFNRFVESENQNRTNCKNFKACETKQTQIRIITGKTGIKERKEIFEWFTTDDKITKIICNVSCIKEGVDLPNVDMVVFCDEKQSRGTRRYHDKKNVMICAMIPIYGIDEFDNIDENLDLLEGRFQMVIYICTALKLADSRIQQIMDGEDSQLKFKISCNDEKFLQAFNQKGIKNKIIVGLGKEEELKEEWIGEYQEKKELLHELELMKEEEKEIEPEAKIEEDDENFDNEPVIEKPKDVFIR